MATPRAADMKEEEKALKRALDLLFEAEDQTDYRERDSLRMLSATWVQFAKELRLGKSKTKVYGSLVVDRPEPPPAKVDEVTLPGEDEQDEAAELPPQ